MKKVVGICAVMIMSVGLFTSCESENSVDENDALYNVQVDASFDGTSHRRTQRE